MALEHLKQLSAEEMAVMRAKGAAAKAEKAAFNKAEEWKYKLEYLDANHWQELASKYKVRMPAYNEPCTTKGLRKYMKRTGVSNDIWKEHYTSMDYFIGKNPDWVLYGAVGLMLEIREGM